MPLVHSYAVEVKRRQVWIKKTQVMLMMFPERKVLVDKLRKYEQEKMWFEKQIREGKDPGVHIQ